MGSRKIRTFLVLSALQVQFSYLPAFGKTSFFPADKPLKNQEADALNLFAMGMVWKIEYSSQKSISKADLQHHLANLLHQMDSVFSDWSDHSELRQMEIQKSYLKIHKPSKLLFAGLAFAKILYQETNGIFDISEGAKLWLGEEAIGLEQMLIDHKSQTVRFLQDPKRLTFNGFIKGWVVGTIAQDLYKSGLEAFFIDAGGGDQARFEHNKIIFTSHSHRLRPNHFKAAHIVLSANKAAKTNQPQKNHTSLNCISFPGELSQWPKIAARVDAYATAATVHTFTPPKKYAIKERLSD